MTVNTVIFPGPASRWEQRLTPPPILPAWASAAPEPGAALRREAAANTHTGFASLHTPSHPEVKGSQPSPRVGPSDPSIVKCHDPHCARGCHIRSLGLNDLSPSNTAALWFLSDKCGSLGLTKMNVLVYGSQLSAVFWESMDLDLKQGVLWAGYLTLPLSHRLQWGHQGQVHATCQEQIPRQFHSCGIIKFGS